MGVQSRKSSPERRETSKSVVVSSCQSKSKVHGKTDDTAEGSRTSVSEVMTIQPPVTDTSKQLSDDDVKKMSVDGPQAPSDPHGRVDSGRSSIQSDGSQSKQSVCQSQSRTDIENWENNEESLLESDDKKSMRSVSTQSIKPPSRVSSAGEEQSGHKPGQVQSRKSPEPVTAPERRET